MVTTFTPNRGYPLQQTGDNQGTWGDVVNQQLISVIDTNLGGRLAKSVAGGSDVTLTSTEAQNPRLNLTGLLTANINLILPSQGAFYNIQNNSTGAFTVTAKLVSGTGVVVPQGSTMTVFANPDDPSVTSALIGLSIAAGGTGASTANGALVNLGGTPVGISVFTAGTQAIARGDLGSSAVGDAVFVAASTAAGRAALEAAGLLVANTFTALQTLGLGLTVTGAGIVVGTPTGGDKGDGTVNAEALYINGVAVTQGQVATAWVSFDGTTGPASTIHGSFGVSGVTRTGTGLYTITFTTPLTSANYACAGMCKDDGSSNIFAVQIVSKIAASLSIKVLESGTGLVNSTDVNVLVFGP